MPEPIKRLDAVTLYFLPLVLFIFDAAFIHISEPLLAVIATINEKSSIP